MKMLTKHDHLPNSSVIVPLRWFRVCCTLQSLSQHDATSQITLSEYSSSSLRGFWAIKLSEAGSNTPMLPSLVEMVQTWVRHSCSSSLPSTPIFIFPTKVLARASSLLGLAAIIKSWAAFSAGVSRVRDPETVLNLRGPEGKTGLLQIYSHFADTSI